MRRMLRSVRSQPPTLPKPKYKSPRRLTLPAQFAASEHSKGFLKMDEVRCKCGRVYEEKRMRLPVRDVDSWSCVCGEVLREWNGGVCFGYRLIRDIKYR